MSEDVYHGGMRYWQGLFDSRRLADRNSELNLKSHFTDDQKERIGRAPLFFMATADANGRPSCSYRGGIPGFVRITGESTLAFPEYDGNGRFMSMGNLRVNPQVELLFIDFENLKRIVVGGRATVHENHPLAAEFSGAQLIVEVAAERIVINCPRYIHHMKILEYSKYAPRGNYDPPDAEWKFREDRIDYLPRAGKGRNYPPPESG